ncbi:S8 family serine peptidase [Pontibacter sp. 172403-2]|uniref:S8 family serine peptidase n=1 Tax=Pontibacter rufus TaxID=2791028 RepID=UPI0018AFAE1F|nr:S8 family serine peptidase [Pontibacter sp. 172403-2]MBF9255432.1 S8 family serine peptidase [Pontibacter sp. 172403-2]
MFTSLIIRRWWVFEALLFLLPAQPALAQRAGTTASPTRPYTVVYKLKSTANARLASPAASRLQAAYAQIGAKGIRQKFPKVAPPANARVATGTVDLSLLYELTYNTRQSLQQVQRILMSTGAVAYVEPVYLREPLQQPNDPAADSTKASQYYLKLIQAYPAWEVSQGSSDVLIGILDTGARFTHQELKDKLKHNTADPIDGIDNDNDGYTDNYQGWDFADNDNNPSDDPKSSKGHGTAVAGIAAAATNNASGIAGTGFNSMFLPLKVFSSRGSNFGGYEAIVYAADKGCKVINLSWGGEGHSQFEQDIINYAVINKDVVIVAAAGNTDKGAPLNIYPASYDNVLSVGGTTAEDIKVANHTYSYNIDLTAPALNVLSLSVTNDTGLVIESEGTSFAAPMVSGAAALVRAHFPELNARQVMERLRMTTDDIYQLAANQPYLEMLGKGRLNMKKALQATGVKAVRCSSFAMADKQIPYAGATIAIDADFVNYLAPVQNLQVQLTSSSPYITVTQGNLQLGSLGTMVSADNSRQPFQVKIAGDAPYNADVTLRLGFSDGAYTDYQYFTITINPDYVTLDANNLKVTINSMGNLGYNGLNLAQGDGIQYKGGASLLFEGGLLLATDTMHVSDNIRDEQYVSDGDFTSTSAAHLHEATPLAAQEARAVMHDAYPSDQNVGVQVKHIAYAWSEEPDRNFVILEYHIKNLTDASIKKLYTGIFADWDIGAYTSNAADWDSTNQLGYAYNTMVAMPYAGIKLLTKNEPSYYAIDNIGGGAGTLAIEDGFTSEEKFTALSGGVARTRADGGGHGNNISQVVGGAIDNIAPGETRVIAFALLAGDNLEELQQQATAAQLKYSRIKTGPVPLALADTACAGSTPTWTPEHGSNFNFYADAEKKQLLGTGTYYTLPALTAATTIYAANADSVFESAAVPGTFSLPVAPVAAFEVSPAAIFPGTTVNFSNKSINSKDWRWQINNQEPVSARDLAYTFQEPGTYEVKLVASARFGCAETSTVKVIHVQETSAEAIAATLKMYPVPAAESVTLRLLPDKAAGRHPSIMLTNITGKAIHPQVQFDSFPEATASINLKGITPGIYFVHINYSNTSLIRRLVVQK